MGSDLKGLGRKHLFYERSPSLIRIVEGLAVILTVTKKGSAESLRSLYVTGGEQAPSVNGTMLCAYDVACAYSSRKTMTRSLQHSPPCSPEPETRALE